MKLTISQPQFLRSLQTIERAVNDRSALPILANVLLETKNKELVLTATDLDVGVQCRFPLTEAVEPGAVTIPARRLVSIIRELPEEPLTLETKNNHTAILTCGASRFRIPGLPAEDFPVLPPLDAPQAATIAQPLLKRAVAMTMFAMSIEETRFVLNGALLRISGNTLTMVATDGRRLAMAQEPVSGAAGDVSVIMPSKTVRELSRLLQDDADDPVTIAPLKDNQLVFRFGASTLITRLIEGQFPNYQQVIPAPSTAALTCSRALLTSAIRRASLMTTAASQAVVFEIAADRLTVSKESPDVGSAKEELPATYTGSPMTIAFNPEFWLDALKVLETDEATIELSSPEKPAVIRLPNFVYLVLPMKLA